MAHVVDGETAAVFARVPGQGTIPLTSGEQLVYDQDAFDFGQRSGDPSVVVELDEGAQAFFETAISQEQLVAYELATSQPEAGETVYYMNGFSGSTAEFTVEMNNAAQLFGGVDYEIPAYVGTTDSWLAEQLEDAEFDTEEFEDLMMSLTTTQYGAREAFFGPDTEWSLSS